MLKGYIFKEQTFNNEVCALIFNEYLNDSDGIFGNYKNAMAVTKSGSNVTIANGVGIIRGRAVGEDSSTTLDAGTTEMYCKLVIELDLDKVNTSSSFLQASYKIIKSASAYPALTQDNIIGTNSGIYQYELARFRTGTNGITDFQDMRTYIDIPTMYEQIVEMVQNAIDSIEDGSAFALRTDLEALETNLQEATLFEGNGNGNVSLTNNVTNYKYIEIFFQWGNMYKSIKLYNAYGKSALLDMIDFNDSKIMIATKVITIHSTSIIMNRRKFYTIDDNTSWRPHGSDDNVIYITKVIGHNY